MAKPSPDSAPLPRLLVLELWGLGDLTLAVPFLRAAAPHARVAVLAPPAAAPLLARFAPEAELISLTAPWTAFTGKYRLHRWPWAELRATRRALRARHFDLGVSARHDPRDHALLWLAGVRRRLGFARAGSGALLTDRVPPPAQPHRAEHWRALAHTLGWEIAAPENRPRPGRLIAIHAGAARAVRRWPAERFAEVSRRLAADGWEIEILAESMAPDALFAALARADFFVGNDSGPGHVAALLGVPTFTIFGPQLPELFAPQHPLAAWIDGAPCPHKPCFDACRFPQPNCLLAISVDEVMARLRVWLPRLK